MSSAECGSGSLGLVLLAHTTRCIVTILSHCTDLLHANLRLIALGFYSSLLAGRLFRRSFVESVKVIITSTKAIILAWLVTSSIIFWAFPYIVFLFFTLSCAAIIVFLERCENVYLRLRSSLGGAAIREYRGLSCLGRPSRDQLDPFIATTGRILSVLKQSPSFPTSKNPIEYTQPACQRSNRIQRLIRNLAVCLLTLIDMAVTSVLPRQTKKTEPSGTTIQSSCSPQKPAHLILSNQSYRVAQATNFVSTVKDAVLSKIVEYWGRFPSPTLTLRAFRLQMKPFLSDTAEIEPKKTNPSRGRSLGFYRLPTEYDVFLLASPKEDPSLATQQSPAPASPRPQDSRRCRLSNVKECKPFTEKAWNLIPCVPLRAAQSLEATSITPKTTLDLPAEEVLTRRGSSLTSFTGSERKVSQQTVSSRKASSSSISTSHVPTRAATPDVNPLIITTAQPSAYWTGRFLSLQDRFQGESLQEHTLSIFVAAHASKATVLAQQREAYQGRGNLPLSTTTALDRYGTAAIQEAKRLSDEDNRCLRIFLHLDALCGTPTAQKSLHAWQEAYARNMGRDALLPPGTSMEKGFVARLFSGKGRRSLGNSRSGREKTKGKQVLSAF